MPTVTASATTGTSCTCCGTLEAATLQCRIRGGTASLCGHSEYASPSTPPKKYRVETLSGGYVSPTYGGDSTCTGNVIITTICNWSGTCVYDAANCATTNTGAVDCGSGPSATCAMPGNDGGRTKVSTPTAEYFDNTNACYFVGDGGGYRKYTSLTMRSDLTDEDTNQDAIDRLLAGAGGTWGTWGTPGSGGCTGVPPACCLARWEERETDFDFIYQEAEYRVTAGGLNPSTTYNARVEIYRSEFGASSYSLFQTLIISGTTDGSGNFSEDGAIPNEEGFESYAAAAYIVIPS